MGWICQFFKDLPWNDIVQDESGHFYISSDDQKYVLEEESLVKNSNVPIWFMELHPRGLNGFTWTEDCINYNKNLTLEIIKNNPKGIFGHKWVKPTLAFNQCMTQEFMETKLNTTWFHSNIPSNKSIPWEFFVKYPRGPDQMKNKKESECDVFSRGWNMFYLSKRVLQDFLEKNPKDFFGKKWDKKGLIRNKYLTFEFILENRDLFFSKSCGGELCYRQDFPWKILEEPLDKLPFKINMYTLSKNPSLPMDFLESHPNGIGDKKWDLEQISLSKGLTWDFVEAHSDGFCDQKWNLNLLSAQKWIGDNNKIRFKRMKLAER